MKTNGCLTSISVSEKTWKRIQRINASLKVGGGESKAEGISVTDLFMPSAFSRG